MCGRVKALFIDTEYICMDRVSFHFVNRIVLLFGDSENIGSVSLDSPLYIPFRV